MTRRRVVLVAAVAVAAAAIATAGIESFP